MDKTTQMSIIDRTEFLETLAKEKRVLALDLGTKTIGVAVSNPERTMVFPIETIKRTKLTNDLTRLEALLTDWQTDMIVLGMPYNMDGTEGPRCQATRAFADNVTKGLPQSVVITFHDERLSTHKAETLLIDDLDLSRKKRKGVIDQMAAVQILKAFLMV